MSTLSLRFAISLSDTSYRLTHHGPLFHRWLPDGEGDAVPLPVEDPDAELKVWFERFGFKPEADGFIVFDCKRREVDPDVMSRQAVLDAGPLIGSLKIREIPREQLTPVINNKAGDSDYVALGKRVVELIQEPVARFLSILRTNYGQYWIRELERWDSRRYTLGAYCSQLLDLHWSLDEGRTWTAFVPDDRTVYVRVTMPAMRDFGEYLTSDDWQELEAVNQQVHEVSLAASLLSKAHERLDQGDLKHALVEGVSALQVALREFVRRRSCMDRHLAKEMQAFWELPLRAQLIAIVATLDETRCDDLRLAVRAIEMRNKVVHDGCTPPGDAGRQITGLLQTISVLLPGRRFKFPRVNSGNKLMSLQEWENPTQEDNQYG